MAFRSSPYIDFDSGIVTKPPMQLVQERKPPRSLEDMLDLFECRVDVWQLGPAVHILKQMESNSDQSSVWAHTAYALLAIIFSYFEMIGKTLNPRSQPRNTAAEDFNYGFCDVYPSFNPSKANYKALPDVTAFRDRVRNGLYHLGYTKGGLFLHNDPAISDDFLIDRGRSEYLVNPHATTRTVVGHFPSFMDRLRDHDPARHGLRIRFGRFFTEFHNLKPP
jgi:hypothetical protein